MTFKVSMMWAASWDFEIRLRLERILSTAHASAMGLEPGLRYMVGPAVAEEGVGSSSTKAE